ncbi:MAG: tetratricopeptide repeat protein [Terracidiphilus sp.]
MFSHSKKFATLIPILGCAISVTAAAQSAPSPPDRKAETQHLIDIRQLDSAEKIIVDEMMASPRDADWITQLAEVRLGENRTREALELIDSANKIAGITATRAMLTSLAFSQAGYMDRAEAPIRKAIELEPFNATAHYFLARLLYTDNRFDECIEESKKVIDLAPGFVRAYENMGLCYEGRYQRGDAEKAYLKAIELESASETKTEWPMVDLAILMIAENRYDEAKPYLVQALQINPNNTQSLVQMGSLLEMTGNLEGALAQYRLAIHSDETGLQPGRSAAYYKAARLCKKLGYTEEAQRYFAAFNEIHDKHHPVVQ